MIVAVDNIKPSTLEDLFRIILKVKTIEYNVHLSDSHINLIIDFYKEGINTTTYANHISKSESNKNYFKSKATIDNSKTYLKKKKILVKNKSGELEVSPDFLPPFDESQILLTINVLHDIKN